MPHNIGVKKKMFREILSRYKYDPDDIIETIQYLNWIHHQ